MSDDDVLHLSWSRLKSWETCRRSVHLAMQGKSSPVVNGRVFLPGTIADRAMRKWLSEPEPSPGGMLLYVDELLEEHSGPDSEYVIKWRGNPNDDRAKVRSVVRKVLTGLEPYLETLVLPYKYQPELRFKTPMSVPDLEGKPKVIILVGGIDVAVQDDHEDFHIYDLKATENDDYVRGGILGQLIFYDIAFGAWIGDRTQPKTRAFLTPACREKIVPVAVTDEDRRVMMSRIVAYCHGVWKNEWQPTEDEQPCWNCGVKHACDRWSPQVLKDEVGRNRASFALAAERRGSSGRRTRPVAAVEQAAGGEPAEVGAAGGEGGSVSGTAD